jgi:hypothetical protein
MEHVLRPEVPGFDYPTIGDHFSSEKQKKYTKLDGLVKNEHMSRVKDRADIVRSLRRYELNH